MKPCGPRGMATGQPLEGKQRKRRHQRRRDRLNGSQSSDAVAKVEANDQALRRVENDEGDEKSAAAGHLDPLQALMEDERKHQASEKWQRDGQHGSTSETVKVTVPY